MSDQMSSKFMQSSFDPMSPTDGSGSLEDNKYKFWFNMITGKIFFHDGKKWEEYDNNDKWMYHHIRYEQNKEGWIFV